MRVEEGFQQVPFPIDHPYLCDPVLPSLLKRILPESVRSEVEADLTKVGERVISEIRALAPLVQPSTLTQYDEWGRRIDRLNVSEGWRRLRDIAVEEGYVGIAYERKFGHHSRPYMFAKTMVMTGDSHVVMCPFGMTDAAARVIELFGSDEMKQELYPRLISRNSSRAYTSGQWMTERPGGSDVSQTETKAVPTTPLDSDMGAPYILNGFKWFSSAAEGNVAVALARTGDVSRGSRSLSLFLVPLRIPSYPSPLSNGIHIHRLKNKIGTLAVPTAELSLQNVRAWRIGVVNEGIKAIIPMLNITRIHSAIHSVGSLQRCLLIARSYATVRTVDGGASLLKDVPLHVAGLADINLLYRALVHLVFGAACLLGKSECGMASTEEESRLRLLTPTAKAFAAQKAPTAMEEAMAALGGQGYMEEVGIGRLIRDSLVEKIWEGTINILSLDLLRAVKDPKAVEGYIKWGLIIISSVPSDPALKFIETAVSSLKSALQQLPTIFKQSRANPLIPRLALNCFANVSCGIYLLEHAVWSYSCNEPTKDIDLEAFLRWILEGDLEQILRDIEKIAQKHEARALMNSALVYGPHSTLAHKL